MNGGQTRPGSWPCPEIQFTLAPPQALSSQVHWLSPDWSRPSRTRLSLPILAHSMTRAPPLSAISRASSLATPLHVSRPVTGHFAGPTFFMATSFVSLDMPLHGLHPLSDSLTGSAPSTLIGPLSGPPLWHHPLVLRRLTGTFRQPITHADREGPAASLKQRHVAGAPGESDAAGATSAPALLLHPEL